MKISKRLRISIIVLLSVLTVLTIAVAIIAFLPSSASGLDLSAKLSELVGVVEVRNGAQDKFSQVNEGFVLKAIMQLQTKEESRARLDLSTGSIVRLGQNTIFSLDPPTASSGGVLSRIELQVGRVWIILKGGSLDVNTPSGLASVRGSYMSVWVEPITNRITVCCLEGTCRYKNAAGAVEMTSGQKIVSSDTNILPTVEKMDQTDIKSWIDNSPESAVIIPRVSYLVASSTPSLTPDATLATNSTSTLTPTATPTITSTPCLGTYTPTATFQFTPTQTYTPTATNTVPPLPGASPTATVTNTPTPTPTSTPCLGAYSPTVNYYSTPTGTKTPTFTPTRTRVAPPSPLNTPTEPGSQPPTATEPPPPPPTSTEPPPPPPTPTANPYP
ncbi:MAG: hypothetical protein A2Y53_07695 [Chloroflexi bacterium RBG_16_47_49]|nr:MAG: hypothetical protein A2Y53_07695 [Chloroflexi bacterium RBG_16_47_49]